MSCPVTIYPMLRWNIRKENGEGRMEKGEVGCATLHKILYRVLFISC